MNKSLQTEIDENCHHPVRSLQRFVCSHKDMNEKKQIFSAYTFKIRTIPQHHNLDRIKPENAKICI